MRSKKTSTEAALYLLGRRDYSVAEIRQKLAQKGYDENDIAHTVIRLKELEYLDDAKYARHFVSTKARVSGWGKMRIEMSLRQKQITDNFIEKALLYWENRIEQGEELPWVDSATDLLDRRYGKACGRLEMKEFQKQMGFLLRRGFNMDEAREALDKNKKEV